MFLKTAALALFSVFLATAGQLLLRNGMEKVGYIGSGELGRPVKLLAEVATTPQVVLGLGLFGASAVSWLIVLSRAPLSLAYPFAGLTYILTALFSRFVLKEQVSWVRWLGIFLILTGILIVGRSGDST
ncbi:MAG TPA: EamA family transporter [Actinomycetota bacterium]|nr:EamA family transporter [Actinomycetota bacterium]